MIVDGLFADDMLPGHLYYIDLPERIRAVVLFCGHKKEKGWCIVNVLAHQHAGFVPLFGIREDHCPYFERGCKYCPSWCVPQYCNAYHALIKEIFPRDLPGYMDLNVYPGFEKCFR